MAGKSATPSKEVVSFEEQFAPLVQTDEVMDPLVIQKDILLRILAAESFLDTLDMADAGTLDARDLADAGWSFVITEQPQWYRGRFTEGSGFFVVLPIRFVTGEHKDSVAVVSVGGVNVLGQLRLAHEKGGVPTDVPMRFKKVGTASGFDVLWLAKGESSF
jgi:hypothetical protein